MKMLNTLESVTIMTSRLVFGQVRLTIRSGVKGFVPRHAFSALDLLFALSIQF